MKERRKHTRVPVKIPAGIYFKGNYHYLDAEILDLSESGAFLQCSTPLELGKEIMLEIRFGESRILAGQVVQDSKQLTNSFGKDPKQASVVRWNKMGSDVGFGVEFMNLAPEKLTFLRTVIQHLVVMRKLQDGRKKKS
ncbi:MAG: PilZ domain-containing protein [Deltaproteobacteria bacterium]|nr:PilZ domain-containing protein [Deltaproteobacteria bacterium]MBI3295989.1 PilZ domain-containing protein [Deltaproteobacteria bacterium]